MNSKNKVSVIIPAYNHGRYIAETIRSVWSQTYENIEIIAINDGSPDNTGKILDELSPLSPCPIVVQHQENRGLCATLNRAIELASGDYISVIASDDFMQPDKTQLQVDFLDNNPEYAGVWGDMIVVDDNSQPIGVKSMAPECSEEEYFRQHLCWRFKFALQSALLRSSIVRKFKFDESANFEDWDFYVRLLHKHKLKYLPSEVVNYRAHEDGLNRKTHLLEEHALKQMNQNIEELSVDSKLAARAHFGCYHQLAKSYSLGSHHFSSYRCLLCCLRFGLPEKRWFKTLVVNSVRLVKYNLRLRRKSEG